MVSRSVAFNSVDDKASLYAMQKDSSCRLGAA